MSKKLKKIYCEVCNEPNTKILEAHHIIERTELNTDNSPFNLAVLCPTCHSKHHAGLLEIIGVFPSTKENGRILIFKINGVCNVPALENYGRYYTPKPKKMDIK